MAPGDGSGLSGSTENVEEAKKVHKARSAKGSCFAYSHLPRASYTAMILADTKQTDQSRFLPVRHPVE